MPFSLPGVRRGGSSSTRSSFDRGWRVVCWLLAIALWVLPVHAEPKAGRDDVFYHKKWRKFGLWDFVGTGAAAGTYLLIETTKATANSATWVEPVPLIDRQAREALVAESRYGREIARLHSDWLWYTSIAYPVADAAVTPLVRGGNSEAALQMTLMNAQAFTAVGLLVRIPHKWLGRTRPLSLGCEREPDYSVKCGSEDRFASLPGGHFALSVTGASLACAHHLHGELYGGGLSDSLACGGAIAAASGVGVLRMRGDEHWLSDQLVGAAMGVFSGYLLPTLLYYRPFWRDGDEVAVPPGDSNPGGVRWTLLPLFDGDALGAAVLVLD